MVKYQSLNVIFKLKNKQINYKLNMKKLLLLLTLFVSASINAQTTQRPETYTDTNVVRGTGMEIAYINTTKDTLYVIREMYRIFDTIWNHPININERPILIPVNSVSDLRTYYKKEY